MKLEKPKSWEGWGFENNPDYKLYLSENDRKLLGSERMNILDLAGKIGGDSRFEYGEGVLDYYWQQFLVGKI